MIKCDFLILQFLSGFHSKTVHMIFSGKTKQDWVIIKSEMLSFLTTDKYFSYPWILVFY